jgi:predicted ABC-type ATPase
MTPFLGALVGLAFVAAVRNENHLPPAMRCERVKLGGHHVPATDIRRRFKRSLAHLLADYLLLAARWMIWDSHIVMNQASRNS